MTSTTGEVRRTIERNDRYAKLCPDQVRRTAVEYGRLMAERGDDTMAIAKVLRRLPFSLTNDDSRVVAAYAVGAAS
jgi:hypothetical protein